MRILFASAHPHLPQFSGGVQSSTHELALELISRGHDVSALANLMGGDLVALRARIEMKLFARKAARDRSLGYPVYRTWFAWDAVDHVVHAAAPEVVVIQPRHPVRMALEFQRLGVPVVMYLRDVEFQDHGGPIEKLANAKFIANSQFTADKYRKAFGISATVIHPLFQPDRYRVQSMRRNVTFINPHPLKGLDTALEIAARCPDIPFCFVEGWMLAPEERASLLSRLEQLPNVELRPSTRDMREVYRDARMILAPSKWEEAWGRVASEAHLSGIPVVASASGGLPESVGPGGILLGQDAPIESWVAAVRRLWSEEDTYRGISQAALAYSERPALDRNHQIDLLLGVLRQAIGERNPPDAIASRAAGD